MNQSDIGQRLLTAALMFSGAGLAFAWAAWYVVRRFGTRALAVTWLASALVVTTAMTAQIHRNQAALGFTPEQQQRLPIFAMFLPMWIVALGAVALVIGRRVRVGAPMFTARLAGRSVGAFWIGALAYFLAFAIMDVMSLLPGLSR